MLDEHHHEHHHEHQHEHHDHHDDVIVSMNFRSNHMEGKITKM